MQISVQLLTKQRDQALKVHAEIQTPKITGIEGESKEDKGRESTTTYGSKVSKNFYYE